MTKPKMENFFSIEQIKSIVEQEFRENLRLEISRWKNSSSTEIIDKLVLKHQDKLEAKIINIIENDLDYRIMKQIEHNLEDLERFVSMLRKAIANKK